MSRRTKHRNLLAALGFLAPNFLGFFLFVAFPVLFSAVLVVTNWSLKLSIEPRFIWFDNIWRLLGFRPIEGVEPSGGRLWILSFAGSYILLLAGTIHSLRALGGKYDGVRLGGWIGMTGGTVLLLLAFFGGLGVGAGLLGVTLLFGYFFFLTDEDASFVGRGAVGPGLVVGSITLVYILWKPVLARWEPIDVNFYRYLYNTLYLMVAIPVSIAGSLILALILSQPLLRIRGRSGLVAVIRVVLAVLLSLLTFIGSAFLWLIGHYDWAVLWGTFWLIALLGITGGVTAFRTLFYIPTFTAGIAVMLLWKQMFNPVFGPINEGLRVIFDILRIDADPPRWLGDPNWAKPAIMLMGFWTVVGGQNMLLYLAGLANVSPDLYEAAGIDGANRRQVFWNVTWPQLAPTTFFIVIMSTIAGLQGGFEQARVLTNGGPAGSTKTLAFYVYEKAFEEMELGYASAIAWILFIIVFALTALNWRFGNRYVNY